MWKVNKYLSIGQFFLAIYYIIFFLLFLLYDVLIKKKISVEECNASKPGIGFLIEFGFDFVSRKRLSKRNALFNIFVEHFLIIQK